MPKKKTKLSFGKGSIIAIKKRLVDSEAFLTMHPTANKLFLLLQSQWRHDRPDRLWRQKSC